MNDQSIQYIESLFAVDPDLERVIEGIKRENMPQISIAPGYGRLLTILVKMTGASRILEIGALGGYSGICLSRGLGDDGQLISLELREEYAAVAKKHLEAAGLAKFVTYKIGDAKESLKQLEAEGARFDFFFIDADKRSYPIYVDYALRLALPGAVIVGDNSLLHGKVADLDNRSESAEAIRTFNRMLVEHPRLDTTILPAYDGLTIARVKA